MKSLASQLGQMRESAVPVLAQACLTVLGNIRKIFALLLFALMGFSISEIQAAPSRVFATGEYRNLFHELLGKSEAELDAKLVSAWQQLFYGDNQSQRVYYPVGDDLAYIADVGSGDVRSEGMSYGMMIAVQLDKRLEFDRLWKWAYTSMRHKSGERHGYFAWQCRFDGTQIDSGSASDGEEWFAMALLFASHRWGDGDGLLNYGGEAQALLREMIHKPATANVTAIFDPTQKQVVFAPTPEASKLTDPSYHVPAFYEL